MRGGRGSSSGVSGAWSPSRSRSVGSLSRSGSCRSCNRTRATTWCVIKVCARRSRRCHSSSHCLDRGYDDVVRLIPEVDCSTSLQKGWKAVANAVNAELRSPAGHFACWGTYPGGSAALSPKKKSSMCLATRSWASFCHGISRYSLRIIFIRSSQSFHASSETCS